MLIDQLDHPPNNVVLLTELGINADGTSDRETTRHLLAELRLRLNANDGLFVYLIGHGSYRQATTRLVVSGPDLTGRDFADALASMPGMTTVINAASTSAPFIRAFAGKNRVVCTSTKTSTKTTPHASPSI